MHLLTRKKIRCVFFFKYGIKLKDLIKSDFAYNVNHYHWEKIMVQLYSKSDNLIYLQKSRTIAKIIAMVKPPKKNSILLKV